MIFGLGVTGECLFGVFAALENKIIDISLVGGSLPPPLQSLSLLPAHQIAAILAAPAADVLVGVEVPHIDRVLPRFLVRRGQVHALLVVVLEPLVERGGVLGEGVAVVVLAVSVEDLGGEVDRIEFEGL
jgi:hypothetical protein